MHSVLRGAQLLNAFAQNDITPRVSALLQVCRAYSRRWIVSVSVPGTASVVDLPPDGWIISPEVFVSRQPLRSGATSPAVALLLVAVGIASAGWSPIQQLTSSPDNSLMPTVGRGLAVMNHRVHLIYADKQDSVRYLFYLRSTDRGTTFSDPVVVETESEAYKFSIAADSSGNVHVINVRPGGQLWYRRSTNAGMTWQTSYQVRDLGQNPLLFCSGPDNVHMLDYYSDNNLYINTSTDGGTNWQGWRLVTAQEGYTGLCAAAGGSALHVAFGYGASGTMQTYYVRSTDRGANWSGPVRLSTQNQTGPLGIWADGRGAVYLSYAIFGSARNFRRSTDGGQNWLGEQTLRVYVRSLAAAGDRHVGAVGLQDDNRELFMLSKDFGATWSDTVNISGAEPSARAVPEIGADDNGGAHVIWSSRQTGNYEIFHRFGADVIGLAESEPAAMPTPRAVYPNPARHALNWPGAGPAALHDHSGRRVAMLQPGANSITGLRSGVYFIVGSDGRDLGRLVKTD